jgi:orotidine-5'-phosphate decarboxylase
LLTSRAPYRSWAANLAPAAEALLQARERLILALDFRSAAAGFDFLKNLRETTPSDHCLQWVKVGLELYLASGPSLVERLIADGYKVFLDLKLHDIPNTVAGAVRSVLPLGPALLTVHAAGGPAMLAAAADAAAGLPTQLLAVTVLTSMSAQQLEAIGVSNTPARQVERLAAMADDSGIHGLVCSPLEVSRLRALLPAAHLVTPGVRPAGAEHGDQQRVSTPWDAIRRGASQLVVGRPITQAVDPAAACVAILQEIAAAL